MDKLDKSVENMVAPDTGNPTSTFIELTNQVELRPGYIDSGNDISGF